MSFKIFSSFRHEKAAFIDHKQQSINNFYAMANFVHNEHNIFASVGITRTGTPQFVPTKHKFTAQGTKV